MNRANTFTNAIDNRYTLNPKPKPSVVCLATPAMNRIRIYRCQCGPHNPVSLYFLRHTCHFMFQIMKIINRQLNSTGNYGRRQLITHQFLLETGVNSTFLHHKITINIINKQEGVARGVAYAEVLLMM